MAAATTTEPTTIPAVARLVLVDDLSPVVVGVGEVVVAVALPVAVATIPVPVPVPLEDEPLGGAVDCAGCDDVVGTTGGTTGGLVVTDGFVVMTGSVVVVVVVVVVVDVVDVGGVVVPPVGSPEGITGSPGAAGVAAGPAGSAAMGIKSPNDCAVTDVATSANTKRSSVDFFSSIFLVVRICMCVGCCYLAMVVGWVVGVRRKKKIWEGERECVCMKS